MLAIGFTILFIPPLLWNLITDLTWRQGATIMAVCILIAGYVMVRNNPAFENLYWHWTMPGPPADEAAFITAADRLYQERLAYADGKADAAAVHAAEAAVCALPIAAKDWVGRITQKYATDSGRSESLAVAIAPHVIVRTAFFPDNTQTLVPAGTALFAALGIVQPEDTVQFDGRIAGHAGACPGDPPVAASEKLRDPEFLFAFSRVSRVGAR